MNIKKIPLVMAIDDQKFYLDEVAYEFEGKNIEYHAFVGPSAFEEDAVADDVNRACLILVDYDFRTCTAMERDTVGFIRDKFPLFTGKIVLLTLLEDFLKEDKQVHSTFDGVINKKNLGWDSLKNFIH